MYSHTPEMSTMIQTDPYKVTTSLSMTQTVPILKQKSQIICLSYFQVSKYLEMTPVDDSDGRFTRYHN